MKKTNMYIILPIFLTLLALPLNSTNANGTPITHTQYLDNGSYIEITSYETVSSRIGLLSSANTKTLSQTKTYKTASGKKIWSLTLKATFNTKTKQCTACSHNASVYSKGWVLSNISSKKFKNTALANGICKKGKASLPLDITITY